VTGDIVGAAGEEAAVYVANLGDATVSMPGRWPMPSGGVT
jgi:hypothetical protein